ncbi:hypothetical protein SCHPADRAFT_733374 [Schizopora paradoxa]|uniref:Uncharacterized protein n=1 Tax=Schizopora paradoxa TaxID=27342 RepID=A0A0H2R6U0_9AGAM|nr:hypothetical protein SCHPADRAFT_733374 [Schizopora paradoxa]
MERAMGACIAPNFKLADGKFNPSDPKEGTYTGIVDMYEHGPLLRTDSNGLPLPRRKGSFDYPCTRALLESESRTRSLMSGLLLNSLRSLRTSKAPARICKESSHQIIHKSGIVLPVEIADSKDGALIVLDAKASPGNKLWSVALQPGTPFYTFENRACGSFMLCNCPLEIGQQVTGSRSPAAMNFTHLRFRSIHGIIPLKGTRPFMTCRSLHRFIVFFNVRLMEADLHPSSAKDGTRIAVDGSTDQIWIFRLRK